MDELFSNLQTHYTILQITLRLLVPALLGGLIGLNREWVRKPAGLRTHILVALASATFAVLSREMFLDAVDEGGRPDPVRVVEAVVTGVAFLGAGVIIRQSGQVEGMTTGASIWLAGAIGVAGGTGHFVVAGICTGIGIVVLILVNWLERHVIEPLATRHKGQEDAEEEGDARERRRHRSHNFPPYRGNS